MIVSNNTDALVVAVGGGGSYTQDGGSSMLKVGEQVLGEAAGGKGGITAEMAEMVTVEEVHTEVLVGWTVEMEKTPVPTVTKVDVALGRTWR